MTLVKTRRMRDGASSFDRAGGSERRASENYPSPRPSPQGGEADEEGPLLTVIVPVYNERPTVDELLRRVMAAPYDKQVVAVDDGSTDGSRELLRAWAGRGQIELLEHAANQGKGHAIRTALAAARGRFTIIQDADLECDPQDYPALVEPLLRGEADAVYGSRYLRRRPTAGRGDMACRCTRIVIDCEANRAASRYTVTGSTGCASLAALPVTAVNVPSGCR